MRFRYLLVLLAICAQAQEPDSAPLLHASSVQNAADFSLAFIQDDRVFGGVARGSIFLLQGGRLGPQELVGAQPPYPLRLPDVEGGTRVEVRSLESEEAFNAPLIYSWAYQVAAILPSAVPQGLAEVRVIRGALSSEAVRMMVLESRPGVFTLESMSGGPAAAQVYRSSSEQPVISLTGPARPGDVVTLWATGLGPIEGDDNSPPVGTLRNDIRIRIGETEIVPDYAGRAPGQPGLDQINFRLPEDRNLPNHCYVPFSVSVGDSVYGNATLSLGGASGPCAHPWGLSEEKLRTLDQGGRVNVVDLRFRQTRLRRTPNNPMIDFGSVQAMLAAVNATGTAVMSRRYGPLDSPWLQPAEGCSAVVAGSPFFVAGSIIGGPARPADGPTHFEGLRVGEVRAASPMGEDLLLERPEHAGLPIGQPVWEARIEEGRVFPTPGEWVFRIGAGPDLPALEQAVTLPDVAALPQPKSLRRGEDQELTWAAESFSDKDWLRISYGPVPENSTHESRWSLSCRVRAAAGALTIPGDVTLQLPEEAEGETVWHVGLDQGDYQGEFAAEGVDRAVYSYSFMRSGLTEME